MNMDGHYDREADIAWLRMDRWDASRIRVEEVESGLIERDRDTGRILGLEYWQASKRLPAELLEALPSPKAQNVIIERQPVA
jgi:uncharacterized protein YuzE